MAVHVQYTTVIVSYKDTLTEGGRGGRVAVRVQFTVSYMDNLTEGGVGERVAVRVQYTYCHSLPYPPLLEYPCKSQ